MLWSGQTSVISEKCSAVYSCLLDTLCKHCCLPDIRHITQLGTNHFQTYFLLYSMTGPPQLPWELESLLWLLFLKPQRKKTGTGRSESLPKLFPAQTSSSRFALMRIQKSVRISLLQPELVGVKHLSPVQQTRSQDSMNIRREGKKPNTTRAEKQSGWMTAALNC